MGGPRGPLNFAAAYTIHNIRYRARSASDGPLAGNRHAPRQPVSRTVAHSGTVFALLETVVLLARRLRSGLCRNVLNCVHEREAAISSHPAMTYETRFSYHATDRHELLRTPTPRHRTKRNPDPLRARSRRIRRLILSWRCSRSGLRRTTPTRRATISTTAKKPWLSNL